MVEAMEIKAGFKQTEVGVIPSDWEVVYLNDCMSLLTDFEANGSFEDVAKHVSISDKEDFAWYVRATDLENNSELSKVKYVDEKSYKFLAKTKLYGGEVLITKRGEIGKVYYFQKKSDYATVAPNMYLLNLNEKVVPFYIYSFFRSVGNRLLIEKNASTTLGALYKNDVKSIKFAIPTKTEQTAIATALNDADALITRLEKLIAKKRAIKQGVMQELLKPKEGWEVKPMGQVAELYQPVTISQEHFTDDGYLVYGANGIVGKYSKYNHEHWQTIITCRGSTCGTVNKTIDKCWITGNAMVANVDKNANIDKLFFYFLLTKQDFTNCITGSGQPQIIRKPLSEFEISSPKEKTEQTRIAQILSDMDAEIEALEKKLEKHKMLKQGMLQVLLTGKVRLI